LLLDLLVPAEESDRACRPDLAQERLADVTAPTLLIVVVRRAPSLRRRARRARGGELSAVRHLTSVEVEMAGGTQSPVDHGEGLHLDRRRGRLAGLLRINRWVQGHEDQDLTATELLAGFVRAGEGPLGV
jgi:hypothetical protein